MAEIGSVQQPGAAKPPEDTSAGTGEPAVGAAADAIAVEQEPASPVEGPADAPPETAREPPIRLAVVEDPAQRDGERATSFLQRAALRRRIRFLRRCRELALHDLGGFVYEAHRLGESRPELTASKLAGVDEIDGELATLERALRLGEELIVLHEPGISSCAGCATIHDSAARFCPGCGRPTSRSGA